MRKRRRLANKLTIMVCAVLIAVSTFFYAPMEVSAEEISLTVDTEPVELSDSDLSQLGIPVVEQGKGSYYDGYVLFNSNSFDLIDRTLDLDAFYAVHITGSVDAYSDVGVYLRNSVLTYGYGVSGSKTLFFYLNPSHGSDFSSENVFSVDTVLYGYGRELVGRFFSFSSRTLNRTQNLINFTFDLNFNIDFVTPLTGEESESYQQGYNAGYSAGEEVGESNGYSSGYSDGYEAGEQSGYDTGFQAGKDSVDTQSYYDAGYSAGYDAGYLSGYDTGYDEGYDAGWSAYEAQMDKWGADTTDYPLLLFDKPLVSRVFSVTVKSSIPTKYSDFAEWTSDLNFNSNHTYRFNVVLNPTEYKEGSTDIYFMNSDIFYFNIGGINYHISNFSGSNVNTFFVPGDRMSSAFSFSWEPLLAVMGDTFESGSAYCYYDLSYQIYDMGPSGDTQNHIANQTDQLTNGYDDSKGNTVNSELSTGLNEYETAENSLFATATTGMKDFTFFDFESVPAMLTAVTFITSIMGSWFEQAGGASGVGIVLSILFSVMLVSMVLGLYRLYQSAGHRAEARERHRERMEQWKRGK